MRLQVVDRLSSSCSSQYSPPTNHIFNTDLAKGYEKYGSDADAETIKSPLNDFLADVETLGSFATSGIHPGDVINGYMYALSGGSLSHASRIKSRKS